MSNREFRKLERELRSKSSATSSVLLISVVAFVVIFVYWASITEIDNVVRGQGEIVSEETNQLVQSSEPGVIIKRFVEEGDSVEFGEILMEIDPIEAKTQLAQVEKRIASLTVKSLRLQAEIDKKQLSFPSEYEALAPGSVATETALYRARLADLKSEQEILLQRKEQKQAEITEWKIKEDAASRNLRLIEKEIETVEPLVKSGLAPETRLISLQREEQAAIGEMETAASAQDRVSSALTGIDMEYSAIEQKYVTSALNELSSIEISLTELETQLPALLSRVDRTTVKSPTNGIVNRINFATSGAFVKSGEVLLELVPTGSNLIVEAKIDPKDIADVVLGQDVKIALTAYDAVRYGRIDGRVKSLSADAINDPATGSQYYLASLTIEGNLYEDSGEAVEVLPGMVASIDVLSGKRTVLDYFWQPISRVKERALRD